MIPIVLTEILAAPLVVQESSVSLGLSDAPTDTGGPQTITRRRPLWRRILEVDVDGKTMQLLKAMREQLGKSSASRTVDAVAAANSLDMDRGALDFHRSMHDLIRADYLEEPANSTLTAQGKYLITFDGIAVTDNY